MKKRYGTGYSIDLISDAEKVDTLKEKIEDIIPDAILETEASGTLTYSLPNVISRNAIKLFQYVESQVKEQEPLIRDWLISHTTLDEVFLRITHGKDGKVENKLQNAQEGQLNILIEGDDDPLGFVDVDFETLVADLRNSIRRELRNAPKEFVFLSNNVEMSERQERIKLAHVYLPLMVIRRLDSRDNYQTPIRSDDNREDLLSIINQLREENRELKELLMKNRKED